MPNQRIFPWFAFVLGIVIGGILAPFFRRVLLGKDIRVLHRRSLFWFQHVDYICGLGHEVGLIFRVIRSEFVKDLELAFRRLEPFFRFALENNGEDALGFGVEFLD